MGLIAENFKLCLRFEKRFVELLSTRTGTQCVNDLQNAQVQLEMNIANLTTEFETKPIPDFKKYESFENLLITINKKLFEGLHIECLGRLRKNGEDVHVGDNADPKNGFFGVPAAEIQDQLRILYGIVVSRMKSIESKSDFNSKIKDFGILSARFLVYFFAIHPFNDGNGRVARIFLKIVARMLSLEIKAFPPEPKERKRYLKFLERAHRARLESIQLGSQVGHNSLGELDLRSIEDFAHWMTRLTSAYHAVEIDEQI
jgi:fido (protein-threonine AMPylation protein)